MLNLDGNVFEIYETLEEAVSSGQRGTSYYDVCEQLSPPDEENP